MKSCDAFGPAISLAAAGALEGAEAKDFFAHQARCLECTRALREGERVLALARSASGAVPVGEGPPGPSLSELVRLRAWRRERIRWAAAGGAVAAALCLWLVPAGHPSGRGERVSLAEGSVVPTSYEGDWFDVPIDGLDSEELTLVDAALSDPDADFDVNP